MIAIARAAVARAGSLGLREPDLAASTQGLEGTVVGCDQTPYLCKAYNRPRTSAEAMAIQRLIDLREWEMSPQDRRIASTHFSWPAHRMVSDDSHLTTIGVLIPAAEPRFWFRHAGSWHLRDGQHVTHGRTVAGEPTLALRTRFVRDITTAWDLLDRHRLVYADANARNLVFAETGTPSVFLLDADGIRPEGDPTLEYRTQVNWADPYPHSRPSRQSDRYLLALWILRTLTGAMVTSRPGATSTDALPNVPGRLKLKTLLDKGLAAPGARAAPGEYLPVLDDLVRAAA